MNSTPDPKFSNTSPDIRVLSSLGFSFDAENDQWLDELRRAETPLPLGKIGAYELLEEVSRGGQGIVFRARQPGTHRTIALKRLLAGSFSTEQIRLRFQREIEAAAILNHPNIVTVYGAELVDGQPVFSMEWIDGQPATEWANPRSRPFGNSTEHLPGKDPKAILEVFLRITDAVQHAHSRGILHRDLKPSNILVDTTGQPHVLDFGLAKGIPGKFATFAEEASDSNLYDLTLSHGFVGTPSYASPEQIEKFDLAVDERSDIYSLGVVLYEMLTGVSPYGRTTTYQDILQALESENITRPSSMDPRLDRELDTIILTALARDREERYSSVAAFAQDLRRYLTGQPIEALPPSNLYLLRKLIKRNKLATAFLGTVAALLLVFAIYASWQIKRYAVVEQKLSNALLAETAAKEEIIQNVREVLALRGFSPDSIIKRADANPHYPRKSGFLSIEDFQTSSRTHSEE